MQDSKPTDRGNGERKPRRGRKGPPRGSKPRRRDDRSGSGSNSGSGSGSSSDSNSSRGSQGGNRSHPSDTGRRQGRNQNRNQGRNQNRKDNQGRGRGQNQGRGRGPNQNRGGGRGAPQGKRAFRQQTIHLPTTYDVLFYKSLREAEADQQKIRAKASSVDQMNVVLEAEEIIEEYSFADVAELYCGAAWTLIHRRRVEDGWYKERQPEPSPPQPSAADAPSGEAADAESDASSEPDENASAD